MLPAFLKGRVSFDQIALSCHNYRLHTGCQVPLDNLETIHTTDFIIIFSKVIHAPLSVLLDQHTRWQLSWQCWAVRYSHENISLWTNDAKTQLSIHGVDAGAGDDTEIVIWSHAFKAAFQDFLPSPKPRYLGSVKYILTWSLSGLNL